MKKFFGYLKPYKNWLILACIATVFSTFCDLLLPTIMSDILNNGVYRKDFMYILSCCLKMLAVALVGLGTVLVNIKISSKVVAGFCADIREVIFKKVSSLTFEEFGRIGTAALVTRATHDVETVSWIAAEMGGTVVTIPVLFFGGVILSLRKDVTLSLILLSFLPLVFLVVIFIGKRILPLWDKSDEMIDQQNDLMRERLRGIRVIRAFRAEKKEHKRIEDATRTMAEHIIRANVSMELITPVASFLFSIASVLCVYVGGWRMELGANLSGGDIFAVVQYVSLVTSGVVMGAFAIVMLPHAKVAAGRIAQVLNAESMHDPVAAQELSFDGEICMEDVTFSYTGGSTPAVEHISLRIPKGGKVAFIGGTGAGKSTLVQLLLGFRMPTSGRILFDGTPTVELSRYTMRENISCVMQNATIYSGTVRENLQMGRRNAADEDMWQALRIAQAEDFVSAFPEGLEHAIRQSGKNLSGGQKQRLCIARAILKDAPIYIFDDSFSALDFLTEARLRNALNAHILGKTQILITQRITSAMHADCIFVMDQGTLVDQGTHAQLLKRCALYREIYASQTGGETL